MKRTIMNNKGTILTNDPSMTAWGWAVVDWDKKVLDKGCIKTEGQSNKLRIRKGDDTVRRVSEINHVLYSIIKTYNVRYILSELPHGSQNARAAVMIGIVTGVMQTISDFCNIGIQWYSEGDVKTHLFHRQSVTKNEMIKQVDSFISVQWTGVKYKDEAIADALGIYLTAKDQSPIIKFQAND